MSGNPETLTNAAGVVVFEGTTSESGGSQAWQSFAFAFDTPDLATGIPTGITVPAGSLYYWMLSIPDAWAGAGAVNLNIYSTGDGPTSGGLGPFDATQSDTEYAAYAFAVPYSSNASEGGFVRTPIDAPLSVGVGGDGDLAAGTAVLYIKAEMTVPA